MEIIKNGKIPDYSKKFTCQNCGTIFKAERNEYDNLGQSAFIQTGFSHSCMCPVCKHIAYI